MRTGSHKALKKAVSISSANCCAACWRIENVEDMNELYVHDDARVKDFEQSYDCRIHLKGDRIRPWRQHCL